MLLSVRIVLASLISCTLAAAASAATITGVVSSASTAKPLASMTVEAYDVVGARLAQATTDANGRYSLTVPSGSYRVLAYDAAGVYATSFSGGAESFETSPLTDVVSTARVDFALVKAGYIAGTVRPYVTVAAYNLSGTRRSFTSTNASGNYQLALPPGDYKLAAYDQSGTYATRFYAGARTFGEATALHVNEGHTTPATFSLELAAHVAGTAVDKTTGTFLGGIVVYAYTPEGTFMGSTSVNAVGAFSIALAPGTYKFVAADPNREYASAFSGGTRSFTTAAVVDLSAGESMSNLRLELERAAKIGGHVMPIANVVVFAYNLDGTPHASARTDVSGAYELLVAPGTYKLAAVEETLAYATQFYSHRSEFEYASAIYVVSGGNHGGFDFALERAGRISGSVGLPNINVQAYDDAGLLAGSARSGGDGRYTLTLAPGAYRVLAFDDQLLYATSYAGGATSFDATVPVIVIADATVSADIALRHGVRLEGTVSSIDGEPLDDVEIFALDAAGNRAASTMAHGGAFTFSLAAGTYHFIAYDRAGRFAAQTLPEEIVIAAQSPLPIHFVLSGAGRRRSSRH